ncbi:MAG TPA: hypothetical protein VGH74_00660, partial [Planctomycetaceae bacterium]
MADSDNKSQLAGVIGPALLLAIFSVLGYVTYEPLLRSARPKAGDDGSVPQPPSPKGLEALHARLWDDPLVVAYQHSRKKKVNAGSNKYSESKDEETDFDELTATQRDMRATVEYFLKPDDSEAKPSEAQKRKRALVMPVFVPGEPFADDTEHRKRTTYAVISALGVAGYKIVNPDRLSYAEFQINIYNAPTKSDISVALTVPIKLFVPKREPNQATLNKPAKQTYAAVVVCWIDDSQLGSRPLAALQQILAGIFGNDLPKAWKASVDLRIIGPASSDSLLQMAEEDVDIGRNRDPASPQVGDAGPLGRNLFAKGFREPWLLSASATACKEDFDARQQAFIDGGPANSGLTVIRTIGTDNGLACAIGKELILRGAWPSARDDGKFVVLVTESDTHYGRSIARAFRREMSHILHETSDDDPQLRVFNYLQGIDGKLNDPKKDEPESEKAKAEPAKTNALSLPADETDAASGRSQYDYLRRLEDHLQQFHDEKRKQGQPGIMAIGVVGSDVYDKLLVLRALRKKFPRAWFFTTDVDAELARANEYPTTRNLLIASHFGLTLNDRLQRWAPPFRNCYQTSIFLACLYGLEEERFDKVKEHADAHSFWSSERCPHNRSLAPLVFEGGRSGPFQLTMTGHQPGLIADVHPRSPREEPWFRWGVAFSFTATLFALLGLLAIHNSRARQFLGRGSLPQFCLRTAGISALV